MKVQHPKHHKIVLFKSIIQFYEPLTQQNFLLDYSSYPHMISFGFARSVRNRSSHLRQERKRKKEKKERKWKQKEQSKKNVKKKKRKKEEKRKRKNSKTVKIEKIYCFGGFSIDIFKFSSSINLRKFSWNQFKNLMTHENSEILKVSNDIYMLGKSDHYKKPTIFRF